MDKKKNILVAGIICGAICLIAIMVFVITPAPAKADEVIDSNTIEFEGVLYPENQHIDEGYVDFATWFVALRDKKNKYADTVDSAITEHQDFLSEEEKNQLKQYSDDIQTCNNFKEIEPIEKSYNDIIDSAIVKKEEAEAEALAQEQARIAAQKNKIVSQPTSTPVQYAVGNGKLTASGGVNYYNGRKETWYSSNVLYHYRTPEWTCGADGVYRDAEGYVVVAASDHPQGSIINTSYGPGKVLDSGCASGTTDIYTNW